MQGSDTSSMSMTWTSVCIPKVSKVSEGLTVFAFLMISTTLSISPVDVAGDDPLVGPVLRARHLPAF